MDKTLRIKQDTLCLESMHIKRLEPPEIKIEQ